MDENLSFPPNVRDGDKIEIELTAAVPDDEDAGAAGWSINSVKARHNGVLVALTEDSLKDLALRLLAEHIGTAQPGGDPAHTRRAELVRTSVDALLWGLSPASPFTASRSWVIEQLVAAQQEAAEDLMVTIYVPLGNDREASKREIESLMDEGIIEGKIGVSSAPVRFTPEGWARHRR